MAAYQTLQMNGLLAKRTDWLSKSLRVIQFATDSLMHIGPGLLISAFHGALSTGNKSNRTALPKSSYQTVDRIQGEGRGGAVAKYQGKYNKSLQIHLVTRITTKLKTKLK